MKKLLTLTLICSALALSACASKNTNANYGYETQAPYGDSRTVGGEKGASAERTFNSTQRK